MEEKLRLKPDILSMAKRDVTRYQIANDAGVSKTTAYTILGEDATKMQRVDLDTLTSILVDGLGLSHQDILNMKIGELFTINGV